MTIILAILALSFLIIIHEIGHFTVAKLSDIKVHEFSLFMGPKLFSFQKGETTYSLRGIPLGGYVRMEGEEQASEDSRAFNRKPILIRMAVIAAGPIMNILVAILLIFIITSISGYNSTIVGELQTSSPAYQAGIRQGDKVIKYSGKSVVNPMDVELFLFGSKGKPADITVVRGNKQQVYKLNAEVFPENRYILGFSPAGASGDESKTIASIKTDSPAYKAGLRQNDLIISLNGKSVSDGRAIREFLKINDGKPITVNVLRNGTQENYTMTPLRDKNPEQYDHGIYFLHLKGGPIETLKQSALYSYSISRNVLYSLAWLVTGNVSIKEMSGPVGIVTAIGTVVQVSPTFMDKLLNLMNFTALISINLGLFNLIPFPALDGSKLLILSVEGIRRKALPPEREAMISLIGFALLIMLMIFTTFNDVLKLTGNG